ncbi:CBS domain-containing protein CBSX5-like [Ipomoea triloba]|uniref:CBS domain-containing protein CBSX5-like n=1 Tax=Ipomoea triloba TaxID=35885 RepID=UPI00125E6A6D|nr:CBS domain-containing protein CBSX5-like [Ipomoea triloba]
MAVSFLNREVSDLCLGKPTLRPVKETASIAEAVAALKRSGESHVSVWRCSDHSRKVLEGGNCRCIGKICMVDVICFLCKEENLGNISKALESPVSELLPKGISIVTHLDRNSSLLEAIDYILEGTQNLVVPIMRSNSRREHLNKPLSLSSSNHHGVEYCWLTQEDVVRFLLNSIGVFSPLPTFTIESLNIIDHDIMTIRYHDPAAGALSSISRAHVEQTSIAVIDDDNRLIGEISPFTLAHCDDTVAAAIMTLSAGDLMAYIDCCGPTEDLVELVKQRLEEKNLGTLLELMEDEYSVSSISSTPSSSSSDDESTLSRSSGSGQYCMRRSEAITCHPWSSLIAVMIQALAHRASCIWVIEEDQTLVGNVTYKEILRVFRSIANSRPKPGRENAFKQ